MRPRTPAQTRTPYATRLLGCCRAGVLAAPGVTQYDELARQARALEAAVKAGADRTALVLIAACRDGLAAVESTLPPDDALGAALAADGREALNRLANMIRVNDPDPSPPPST